MVSAREGCAAFDVVYMLYVVIDTSFGHGVWLDGNYFASLTSDLYTTFDTA